MDPYQKVYSTNCIDNKRNLGFDTKMLLEIFKAPSAMIDKNVKFILAVELATSHHEFASRAAYPSGCLIVVLRHSGFTKASIADIDS